MGTESKPFKPCQRVGLFSAHKRLGIGLLMKYRSLRQGGEDANRYPLGHVAVMWQPGTVGKQKTAKNERQGHTVTLGNAGGLQVDEKHSTAIGVQLWLYLPLGSSAGRVFGAATLIDCVPHMILPEMFYATHNSTWHGHPFLKHVMLRLYVIALCYNSMTVMVLCCSYGICFMYQIVLI